MADDYSADIHTGGALSIGGSTTGVLETNQDSDWFKLSLTAGTTYLFYVAGGASNPLSTFNSLDISLYNGEGLFDQYASKYVTATGLVGQFVAQTSGTYFLGLRGTAGSYTLKAALPATDDYAAGSHTMGSLRLGMPASGVFEHNGDVDWFKFHAEAGQIIGFSGTGTMANLSIYSNTAVYTADGTLLSNVSRAPFIAAASGDYYLAVSADSRIGAYTESMRLISDDYSGDNSRPGQLGAAGQVTGSIDYYGDADRFQVSLQAGSIYTFTLKLGSDASFPEASLAMYLPSGERDDAVIGAVTIIDGAVTLRYQAASTGVYGINVVGNTLQSYALSLSAGELDDHGNTPAAATPLALDVTVNGKLQSTRDVDMFQLELKAGVSYNFDLSTDSTRRYVLNSELLDSTGKTLSTLPTNGKHYSYTPYQDGTYYLSQYGYNTTFVATTNFTLTASVAADDFGANAAQAGRLAVGSRVSGVIEGAFDRDWFAVTLDAGGYYWFTIDGQVAGGGTMDGASDVWLTLRDSSGTELSSTPRNAVGLTLPFTAPTKGTYYVEVGSFDPGSYTVRAQLGKTDDHGDNEEHATALRLDHVIRGEIEHGTDRDVFKLSLVAGETYAVEVATQDSNRYAGFSVSGPEVVNLRYISSYNTYIKVFEAGQSGDYYVTVSLPSGSNWVGGYTLQVTSLGIDDFSANASTTAVLTPDAPLHGMIGVPDDRDWIKVHLEAGGTYVFDLKGSKSGGGTLDTSLFSGTPLGINLLDSNGRMLVYSTIPGASSGSDPRISYVAQASGDYYIDAHGSNQAGGTGSYTVAMVHTNLDTTAPKLVSSSIADGATGLDTGPVFKLTFDETIQLSGEVTLTDAYGTVIRNGSHGVQVSAAGKTLTLDPSVNLMPGMSYTLSLLKGSVSDLAGNTSGEAQSYAFTVTKPVGNGTAGDDYLIGSGVGLILDGGAGNDTVYYASSRSGFTISRNSDGSASVKDYRASGTSGDKLTGIERLLFGPGGGYALDIEGVAGQAYRLYKSAFNRTPDSEGLGYWIASLDKGLNLRDAASSFIASTEFKRAYGSAPSDADFVKLLYQNVLQRTPDAAGSAYWVDNLQHGQSRADLLVYFSEGKENHDAVAKLIGNGFDYTPYGG